MSTHKSILTEAGGATAVAEKLFPLMPEGRWSSVQVLANTVQGWVRTGSIPPEYWPAIVSQGWASLETLTQAVADTRLPGQAARIEEAASAA